MLRILLFLVVIFLLARFLIRFALRRFFSSNAMPGARKGRGPVDPSSGAEEADFEIIESHIGSREHE